MKCLFVHVPRCGGMSFYYFLQEVFSENSSIRFGDNTTVVDFMAKLDAFNDYSCLSGHIPYRYFADRGCHLDRFTVAFIRNPIEREQSGYGNILKNSYDDHSSIKIDASLYWEKLASDPEFHNIQCSYFSEDRLSISSIKNILSNRICVFDVEDMPIVADIIKNFAKVEYTPRITNSSDRKNITISNVDLDLIKDSCVEDGKLFTWVRQNGNYFQALLRTEIWRSYLVKNN